MKIWRDNLAPMESRRLIIMGDPMQCIYAFSGSDSRYLTLAPNLFGQKNGPSPVSEDGPKTKKAYPKTSLDPLI